MSNAGSLIITGPAELADLAARAAEGITCFRFCLKNEGYRSEIEECRSEIKDGITLCEILKKGYTIEKSPAEIKSRDISVWRAFQKVREESGFDKQAFTELAKEAASVGEGLQGVLKEVSADDANLVSYRKFFLRVAMALGL